MWQRKKNRLPLDVYKERRIYHIIICCDKNQNIFITDEQVNKHLEILSNCSDEHKINVLAYCYMPNHVHLLLVTMDNNESDEDESLKASATTIIKFIKTYKQLTGYYHKKYLHQTLWQKSFYDHILRKEEDLIKIIRYIFENPVRKELVEEFCKYRYSGSLKWGKEIFDMIMVEA